MTTKPPTHVAAPGHVPESVRPTARGLGQLLRVRGLRRLVLTRLLASFGDGAFQGALAGAVLFDPSQRSTASSIAAAAAVLVLPYSVLGPFAGALLDRWSRRQVLVWVNLARAVVVAVLAVLLAFGTPIWVLFVVALVLTGSGRFVGSGLSASLPHVIATDSLVGANSLATTAGAIAGVIGAGYALFLRSLIGTGPSATAIATATVLLFYLAAARVAHRFKFADLGPDETDEPPEPIKAVLQGFGAGLRHVIIRPTVGLNIAMVVLVRFCFGLSTLVVVLLFQHSFTHQHGVFRSGIAGVSEVLGVSAVGLFLGAVATAPLVHWLSRTRYVVILLSFAAVVVIAAGAQFTQLSTMISALMLAFAYQSSKICADTVVQTDSDDAHIGRVFALYDTANNVFYVGGFVAGVPLVHYDGRSHPAVILVAIIFAVTAFWYGWWMRAHRRKVAHTHLL